MPNSWLRLWHEMPNDPKWRTIAKAAGQPIPAVVAVYIHLLVTASNATKRGETHDFKSEDVASALDLEIADIEAIITAMQGRVLDGFTLTGWKKRQPLREDSSTERVREHRNALKRSETHSNAPDTDTDTENNNPLNPPVGGKIEGHDGKPKRKGRAPSPHVALPEGWAPPAEEIASMEQERPMLDIVDATERFSLYFRKEARGKNALKADWLAAWRVWMRNADDRGESRKRGGERGPGLFAGGELNDPSLPLPEGKPMLHHCRFEGHESRATIQARRKAGDTFALPRWRGSPIPLTADGELTMSPVPGWPCKDKHWYRPGPGGYDDNPIPCDVKGNIEAL